MRQRTRCSHCEEWHFTDGLGPLQSEDVVVEILCGEAMRDVRQNMSAIGDRERELITPPDVPAYTKPEPVVISTPTPGDGVSDEDWSRAKVAIICIIVYIGVTVAATLVSLLN